FTRVKKIFIGFVLLAQYSLAQTISQCRQRFDNYLNFQHSLNRLVKFETDAVYLLNAKGQKEIAVYANEISALAAFFENSSFKQQEKFFLQKGIKRLNKRICDSLLALKLKAVNKTLPPEKTPLLGLRIAIDAGHFATSLQEAEWEK